MKKTKHAIIRGQQRGISNYVLDLILTYGKPIRKPGNAKEYRINSKLANKIIEQKKQELKRFTHLMEKACGSAVLTVDDKIITQYHLL